MFNIYRLLSTVRETFCCVLVSFTHFYTANRQILTPLYILESTTFCQILGKKAQPSPLHSMKKIFFFFKMFKLKVFSINMVWHSFPFPSLRQLLISLHMSCSSSWRTQKTRVTTWTQNPERPGTARRKKVFRIYKDTSNDFIGSFCTALV